MRGLELQLRTRSSVCNTKVGRALMFNFSLGPIQFFIVANLPDPSGRKQGPLVYIKMNIDADNNWEVFRDHCERYSTEFPRELKDKHEHTR
jgi:hypothetical protein